MKTTRYFREQVLRKRPYIQVVVREDSRATLGQNGPGGRTHSILGVVPELGGRALRVVTLSDGETVHNAFSDRDFTPASQ